MTHPDLTEWRESRLPEWRDADLAERMSNGKVRHIEFRRTTTERSLFRDE